MNRTLLALFAAALVAGEGRAQQCTSSYYTPRAGVGSIGVANHGGCSYMTDAVVATGADRWNSNCGQAATDFPMILVNTLGDVNVGVECFTTPNPDPNGSCAQFDHSLNAQNQVVGGTIRYYAQTGSNIGLPCSQSPEDVAASIGHELGHVLGLGNSPCGGRIMGPDFRTAGPAPDECEQADYQWHLEGETPTGPIIPSYDCPLVLDLNGDGIHTIGGAKAVRFFDSDGDGILNFTGWLSAESEDAFLFKDDDDDGNVDASELFGSYMWTATGVAARNGFQALAFYDIPDFGGNYDGQISSADAVWRSLRLWHDRDENGRSEPSEISTLNAYGIIALSLRRVHMHTIDAAGNILMLRGEYRKRVVVQGGRNRIEVRELSDIAFVPFPP